MFINNFDPVAIEIFSLEIRWYSLAYIFGIILGWILAKKLFIQNMINSESDNCYKCGKPGHFANKCTTKKKPENKKPVKKTVCSRCGRSSHTEENCYAKTDIHGNYIIDSEEEEEYSSSEDEDFNACFRCGRLGHYANTCYARKDINGRRI